jgi:pimeloyl-ACP methyl ester carboxylesterase
VTTPEIPHVVMVHGLWFRELWMRVLARRLEASGFRVKGFNYHSTRVPLERSALRLQHLCERDFPHGVHLVGHSLGGLLILQMLQAGRWSKPGQILFLGTPLTGSAVARRAAAWPGATLLLGEAVGPLVTGHRGWPAERLTGMIAGTRPVGLGVISGGLQKPHDGTVSVVETRHPRLTEHIQLPVTHTGMLYSGTVARQATAFLTRGRFSPVTPGV